MIRKLIAVNTQTKIDRQLKWDTFRLEMDVNVLEKWPNSHVDCNTKIDQFRQLFIANAFVYDDAQIKLMLNIRDESIET